MDYDEQAATQELIRIAHEDVEDLQTKLLKLCIKHTKSVNITGSAPSVLLLSAIGLLSNIINGVSNGDPLLKKMLYSRSGEVLANRIFTDSLTKGEEDEVDKGDTPPIRS